MIRRWKLEGMERAWLWQWRRFTVYAHKTLFASYPLQRPRIQRCDNERIVGLRAFAGRWFVSVEYRRQR